MTDRDRVDLNALEYEISQLKISTTRSISALETKLERLRRRATATSARKAGASDDTGLVTGTVIINRPATVSSNFIIHQDRYGNEVLPGSKVKFLTTGAFDSTEGIVQSSDDKWIRSTDYKGRTIKRAPRNLKVLHK